MVCSHCGGAGHNIRTCPLLDSDSEDSSESASSLSSSEDASENERSPSSSEASSCALSKDEEVEEETEDEETTEISSESRVDFNSAWVGELNNAVEGGHVAMYHAVWDRVNGVAETAYRFWIGISSNGTNGCRARWNQKYSKLGMNSMMAVYRTNHTDNRHAQVEAWLIHDFWDFDNLENPMGGGGGRPSQTPPFVVYVAWEE